MHRLTTWPTAPQAVFRSVVMTRSDFLLLVWLITCAHAPFGNARAQQDQSETYIVVLEEGQTLRDVAAEHLGDPDLWPELLLSSGLQSITEAVPGTALVIPATIVARANRAIEQALATIQAANREGARLFAPEEISLAIDRHEQALTMRQAGAWEEAAQQADDAHLFASLALDLATAARDATAEAILSDREGSVEGRRTEELDWSARDLNAILLEQETVRTLSRSSAQITFTDDSRLRLNANSQAVIEHMRRDPLTRREEATVSLVEGDFYAILSDNTARSEFAVEVAEVETELDSRSFWMRRDDTGSKFTNYDVEGVLTVSANGGSVALGENEGTLVRRGRPPSPKLAVLTAPNLASPADDEIIFVADVPLAWEVVDGAAGYWLEVAADPGFNRMTQSRWGLLEPLHTIEGLDVGVHYWRTAALDNFGLPGGRSEARRFNVRIDQAPPFLVLRAPVEGAVVRAGPVTLRGETEIGATVAFDGQPVETDDAGRFELSVTARPGLNDVSVDARDTAGNVTRRSRSFTFAPDAGVAIHFDEAIPRRGPRRFVAGSKTISVAGQGLPDALVEVSAEDGARRAATYSNTVGAFNLNVPIRGDEENFSIVMTDPTGLQVGDGFTAVIDREPPSIVLEPPVPAVTAVEWLPLRGRADGAVRLSINGDEANLVDGTFDETLTLQLGTNDIKMGAMDLVGNVRVETHQVVLDQEPPEIVSHALSATRAAPGSTVSIEVVARDHSGLRKAAPFALSAGESSVTGYLEFLPATGSYRGTVVLPADANGRLALDEVEVEDYAGNRTRRRF